MSISEGMNDFTFAYVKNYLKKIGCVNRDGGKTLTIQNISMFLCSMSLVSLHTFSDASYVYFYYYFVIVKFFAVIFISPYFCFNVMRLPLMCRN